MIITIQQQKGKEFEETGRRVKIQTENGAFNIMLDEEGFLRIRCIYGRFEIHPEQPISLCI